jgi:hypothetical protein
LEHGRNRTARIEDVDAILAIDRESLGHTEGHAEQIASLIRSESGLIAVEDAIIVGFAGVKPGGEIS